MNARSVHPAPMARKSGSHAGKTRPRIQAAAQELFARHGYDAVSMRQIAARVGVQAGTLYLYTKDKQSLLFELMREHMQALLAAWAEVPRGDGPLQALEAFCRFHIRYHLERPDAVFIAYMELRALEPDNFAAIEALRRRYEGELQAILEAGRAAGVFDFEDARLATMAIIAMLTGVNTWFRDGGRLSRADVERIYADMVARSVRAGRGAAPDPGILPDR